MMRQHMWRKRWVCLVLLALLGCGNPNWNSGDRVLVAKCLYETKIKTPERFDVVVFKYPVEPMKRNVPTNYIKRLLGLPGELIAIFFGQIFRMTPEAPVAGVGENLTSLEKWRRHNQPSGNEFDDQVRKWMEEGQFEIVRKPPAVMMAMRRIVFDNNHQAEDLKILPSRWSPREASAWTMSADRRTFTCAGNEGKGVDWLTYQHLVRPPGPPVGNVKLKPQLITDFMGYNAFNLHDAFKQRQFPVNWVGDLMVECNVTVTQPTGEFYLELNKGIQRFQAKWDLASGNCTLSRLGEKGAEELGSAATNLRGSGTHLVRFANFDSRLTVWVDRELPFGDGVAYTPVELPGKGEKVTMDEARRRSGPRPGDVERPASLGSKGAGVAIADLRLWRDTFYTMSVSSADLGERLTPETLSSPEEWGMFQELRPTPFYVYPGHYLCLGDNSTHSSDSRQWGLVPERLMLGRALMVYYPLNRAGLIR